MENFSINHYFFYFSGMLKPIESETREIRSLDGLWNFRVAASNDTLLGFKQKWYNGPLSEVLLKIS